MPLSAFAYDYGLREIIQASSKLSFLNTKLPTSHSMTEVGVELSPHLPPLHLYSLCHVLHLLPLRLHPSTFSRTTFTTVTTLLLTTLLLTTFTPPSPLTPSHLHPRHGCHRRLRLHICLTICQEIRGIFYSLYRMSS